MDNYEVLEQIGSGSTFLVLHKTENKKYVLKKIRLGKEAENSHSLRSVHQEMEMISNLSHPYIVSHEGMWMEKDEVLCIVTEYCEGEDMASMIKKARGVYFPEEKLCKWFAQLLLAMDYLHSNRILHKNLKCSNIFLTKYNDVQLGDFGIGKTLGCNEITSSVSGTPNHICPELLEDSPYGYKSDIWSLGCCIFEIAAHHPPFTAADIKSLISKIKRSSLSPLPVIYSSSLKQILKTMVRKNPETRPTAAEVLRHYHMRPHVKKTVPANEKSGKKAEKDKKWEISDIKTADSNRWRVSETKGGGQVSLQRADALESLLELCARLLKQDKIDELSKVLCPFGEELVSSPETAICLTKSLIAYHNFEA